MSDLILKFLKLDEVTDPGTLHIIYGDKPSVNCKEKLHKWLSLLPDTIIKHIDAALQQERPFLPPDVTPEMMAVKNSKVPWMSQMEILYRCVHFAFQAKEFNMAACLVYVVDRATYWSGASEALLQVADLIKKEDPLVPIAPQVQVRKARVLKDNGDLHGAMKVLNDILQRRQNAPGEWCYKDDDQYITTQAEIIKVKGHILYNMGLFEEAVEPFLESIRLFTSLQNKDDKGIASCLGLLTKCLGKLSLEEFEEVRQKFPDNFKNDHPCYESYVQGIRAVQHIQSLQESLYSSRHLLDADTSLLKFAILSPSLFEQYNWLQKIIEELKKSLGSHKTVETISSAEQFFELVRALFMISLVLAFSPLQQDRSVAEYIEQISMELYLHLCNHNKSQREARLSHTAESIKLINMSLTVVGLPTLHVEKEISETKFKDKKPVEVFEKSPIIPNEKENPFTDEPRTSIPTNIYQHVGQSGDSYSEMVSHSTNHVMSSPHSMEPSSINSTKEGVYKTVHGTNDFEKPISTKQSTLRGWTYNFGHKTREVENGNQPKYHTFPKVSFGEPLDPKKQWQTYKHKCVGLPVDPDFFALPVPSCENLENAEKETPPLVNLSVTYIDESLKHKVSKAKYGPQSFGDVVDRQATTVQDSSGSEGCHLLLHPHDLPNQPMKRCGENDKYQLDDDIDATQFSPLIDIKKTTIKDFLDLGLGEGGSVDDPIEYINNWKPSKEYSVEHQIHRAFLLNYNPSTSIWTSQSTLVFIGDELELSDDKKGNCRDAFHVQFLHQDEPRGKYVGKKYKRSRDRIPTRYMQDVVCQMMSGYYVTKFNEALQNYKRDIQVQFLPAAHLQLLTADGQLDYCINVEPYLHGDFIKLTNNLTYLNVDHRGKEMATALSHFSYFESKGTLMIVDIQGWLPRDGSGVIYLTDPQFHTDGLEKFSPCDFSEAGMNEFWKSVHPVCNDMCRAIGLERPQQYHKTHDSSDLT